MSREHELEMTRQMLVRTMSRQDILDSVLDSEAVQMLLRVDNVDALQLGRAVLAERNAWVDRVARRLVFEGE
jgi:hypothetical protein